MSFLDHDRLEADLRLELAQLEVERKQALREPWRAIAAFLNLGTGRRRPTYARRYRERVLPIVLRHVAPGMRYDPAGRFWGSGYYDTGLVPPGAVSVHMTDLIEGQAGGRPVAVVEATMRRLLNGYPRGPALFEGLLVRVSLDARDPTHVLIRPRRSWLGAKLDALRDADAQLGQRLEAGDAAFDAAFELRARDPKAARAMLSTGLLAAIRALAPGPAGPQVALAWSGGAIWLAMARAKPLAPASVRASALSLDPPLAYARDLIATMGLVQALLDLADAVAGGAVGKDPGGGAVGKA